MVSVTVVYLSWTSFGAVAVGSLEVRAIFVVIASIPLFLRLDEESFGSIIVAVANLRFA